jgi:hypothetical protein
VTARELTGERRRTTDWPGGERIRNRERLRKLALKKALGEPAGTSNTRNNSWISWGSQEREQARRKLAK